ncbi:uncharacterized protein LOC125067501 [Vanessa atalanta]|uniref:uncharacterized protein LOC125067501 n=1 Tax=Vanessa atalanta TaxID=42275 RepID=UPI001FCCE36C|nr:uncharacterized protein LOC125067501 [Vanessa atalanta]
MSAQVPPLKRNNYLQTSNIIQQMKYLIILETLFGINRLYIITDLNYLPVMAHDMEMVLFCYFLITILQRLSVLKAHVAKVFSINTEDRIDCEDSSKLEGLSKRVNLNVSSVHRLYDLLHKCSEDLNSVMSLSMIVMIVTSGLSTIVILKNTIKLFQSTTTYPHLNAKHQLISRQAILIFSIGRSLKYILMLTFPCYISNKTQVQVSVIRTMIYDTLNSIQLDKVERRKVKAFFQLVCENKYAYALYGIVNLDMSLPLSYSSLCTTYLIIVVQFSKFFD